jgi:hypothetical protein
MSIQKLIQESLNRNPLEMKEALAGELRSRVALALESKISEDLDESEVQLGEAKINDRVRIHKPGKDYHGYVGTIGEIRKRTYGSMKPSYTVDYYKPGDDHRYSVSLDRSEFKKHVKESFDLSDYTVEELEDFMVSEGIFDKISIAAARSIPGALKMAQHIQTGDVESLHKEITKIADRNGTPGSEEHTKIVKGLYSTIASGKMKNAHPRVIEKAKKMTETFDFTLEELEDFMVSEDFDQLDELSRKTLASYVKKASDSAASKGIEYGAKKAQSDEMDRMMNRHMSFSDKDKVRSIMKTTTKDVEAPRVKAARRLRGIDRAANRLSKD